MRKYEDECRTSKDSAGMVYVIIKTDTYTGEAKPYGNSLIGVWLSFYTLRSLNLFKKSLVKSRSPAEIRLETDSEVVLVVPEQNAREFLRNIGAVRKKVLTVAQREALAKRMVKVRSGVSA